MKIGTLLVLNQMAGPMTWELAEELTKAADRVALLTGHPDTLSKGGRHTIQLYSAVPYDRGSIGKRLLSWFRYVAQALRWIYRWPSATPLLLFSNPPVLS